MGVKGYLVEKSVLEIWAARPGPDTPLAERTRTSRDLAAKYHICYKTVHKIWNKVSWAKLTDRADGTTHTEGQPATADPEIDTATTAAATADALSQVEVAATADALSPAEAEGELDCELLPPPACPPPAAPSSFVSYIFPPHLSSNAATHDNSPDDALPSPFSSTPSLHLPSWSMGGSHRRVDSTCFHCKARKLRCDGKQPCGRCCKMGLASKCAVGGENQAPLLPSVELHGGGSGARNARAVAPEHPIPYPDGPVKGVSFIVPALGPDSPWPQSLVRMFKAFRLADSVYLRMLRLMTPRLHAIVLRIFGAMDGLLVARKQPPTLGDLPEWNKKSGANSLRCGIMSVRHDKSAEMMTGVYANPFWTDLAGLHKEEFTSRAFNGDLNLNTSELRQFSRLLVYSMKMYVKWKIAQLSDPDVKIDTGPLYQRISRNWGRGSPTADGVLTRTRAASTADEHDASVQYVHTSMVIIPAEEYEAVRAEHPELCEGYLIPVVGPKSAQELMDPRLLVDESFEHMNSHPEGRAQLDRLADVIADEYSFMFDFFAAQYQKLQAPSGAASDDARAPGPDSEVHVQSQGAPLPMRVGV